MSLISVKEEPESSSTIELSEAEIHADLYADHEIKNELVLGPVLLQPPDSAYSFNGQTKTAATIKKDEVNTAKVITKSNVEQHVKHETESDEEPEDQVMQVIDLKVKQELLETKKKDCVTSDLHTKQEHQKIKQEKHDSLHSATLTENASLHKSLSETDDKQLLKKRIKNNKKTKTKSPKVSTRLRIRYEEDSDDYLEEVKLKRVKQKKIHKCTYCSKEFAFRPGLTNHIRTHTGEKPYSCKICSKKFSDYAVLVRHRKVHTGAKPHICEICENKYSEKYLLKNHMRVHTGEKTYFCKDCPKTFINSSNYRRHLKVHMHKYSCDICKRQFERKATLVTHIVNHMRPKPHKCRLCDKSFGQSGHLYRHMAVHNETREIYACGVCKKEFTQHASLKKHVTRRVCERKRQMLKTC